MKTNRKIGEDILDLYFLVTYFKTDIVSKPLLNNEKMMNSRNASTDLGEFVLHVSEDEEEATDGVPQSAVSQRQLITSAWTLKYASTYQTSTLYFYLRV